MNTYRRNRANRYSKAFIIRHTIKPTRVKGSTTLKYKGEKDATY
jgi:hypothetical protein